MRRRDFRTTGAMCSWLKGATGVVIASVGIIEASEELYTNMTSSKEISSAIEECQIYDLQESGRCFVEYEASENDALPDDLDCNRYIGATMIQVRMQRSLRRYGGHQQLLSHLSKYEYLLAMRPPEPGFQTGLMMVRMPKDPAEIEEVKNLLLAGGAVSVTVPDGSGEIHAGNTFWGKNPLHPT